MVNHEIADIFNKMAAYLEMFDDKNAFFRARALKKAAETLERFPHDLEDPNLYKDIEKLKQIDGIGDRTAHHIQEYIKTRKIPEYEDLKKQSPVNLEELLKIQGIGPKKILKLYKELEVKDIKSLEEAALSDKISKLPGFGEKSQEGILSSIKFAILNKDRVLINIAENIKDEYFAYLKNDNNIELLEYGGSLRRRKETIGDIDFLVSSKNVSQTMDYFTKYKQVEKILSKGETKSSVWLNSKIQVDLRVVTKESFGAALQYFTGNKEHNVTLRNIAISKGYKLSEYGLFKRDHTKESNEGKLIEGASEIRIYNILGLDYIEPELRENTREFEAAKNHKLPKLISMDDIQGDLHMHTTHSDGKESVESMASECLKLGYKYIGISDHFGKLAIAGAISSEEFEIYLNDIKTASVHGIKILAGGEVDISKEGDLEFDEAKLKKLDYVIASVHLSTKMDKSEMTKRITKALRNPLVKILGHPTGRLLGQRPGFEFDIDEVLKVAKNEGVALEINAHPLRLDLPDYIVTQAIKIGCKISINTDAHSIPELYNMKYGVYTARRGWVEKTDLHAPDIH